MKNLFLFILSLFISTFLPSTILLEPTSFDAEFKTSSSMASYIPSKESRTLKESIEVVDDLDHYDHDDYVLSQIFQEEEEEEEENIVTMRLYGNTVMGYYYISLFFGSQLHKQNLIVDTGSTITTIPCTECGDECGNKHFNEPFDPSLSTFNKNFECSERFSNFICVDCENKCPFQIGYTEGSSYEGHFTKDTVVFGNDIEEYHYQQKKSPASTKHASEDSSRFRGSSSDDSNSLNIEDSSDNETRAIQEIIKKRSVFLPFGCTVKETKLFYSQEADGILGLGVYTNGPKIPPNVVDVFGISKPGVYNSFSICYAEEGGLFTMGGYNQSYHDKSDEIKYVPFYSNHGQYRVHVNRIEFEGSNLGISEDALNEGQGAFFDSGTTLVYAPSPTVSAIKSSLNSFCAQNKTNCGGNKKKGNCWFYNPDIHPTEEDFFASFGVFAFYLGMEEDHKYEWRAQDYLYQENFGSRWFCLGIDVFEDRTILGGTFMKNHDIIFDKREKRIGFIKANCTVSMPEWIPPPTGPQLTFMENVMVFAGILALVAVFYFALRVYRKYSESRYLSPLTWIQSAKTVFSFRSGNSSPTYRYARPNSPSQTKK